MLSRAFKNEIIEKAQEIIGKVQLSSNQLRNYLDVLNDPSLELFKEYEIYLRYQLKRNVKNKEVADKIIKIAREIHEKSSDNWKEAMKYFFGIMIRLATVKYK